MTYYAFNLRINYADEFDTETLFIVTDKGLKRIKQILQDSERLDYYEEIYFGTNEGIHVGRLRDACSGTKWYRKVTKNDVKRVLKVFGNTKTVEQNITEKGIVFTFGQLDYVFDNIVETIEYLDDEYQGL